MRHELLEKWGLNSGYLIIIIWSFSKLTLNYYLGKV